MEQVKHYYAFISHATEDKKTAFWLRRKLEGYHIPTSVQNEVYAQYKGVKKFKPCFVYQTDLAGNDLNKSLKTELNDSQYLIVVCSPVTPRSQYVNKEVRHFIKQGLAEKIIPYIVKGTPVESFPAAIKELAEGKLYNYETGQYEEVEKLELRGINAPQIRKDLKSRNAPIVNVIATMLGVRFDSLWDRFKRKHRMHVAAIAMAASICLLAGLFLWDYLRPTYEYYADYVERWGKPEGIYPLTKDQVRCRLNSYQFEKHRVPLGEPNGYKWRLSKVSLVNSAFRPIDHQDTERKDRFSVQKIEYHKQDTTVKMVVCCDTKDKVLMRLEFSERDGLPAAIADIRNAREQLGNGYLTANVTSLTLKPMGEGQTKANIVRYVYQRDEKGHIISQTYHRNNDDDLRATITGDSDGIFGVHYTLDSLGRCIALEYVGKDGEKVCTKRGVGGKKYEYDENCNLYKTTYVDLEGNPTMNELLFAICVQDYDGNGNVIKESLYDSNNHPCVCSLGWSTYRIKIKEGLMISIQHFDSEDRLCLNSVGFAEQTMAYDKYGNAKEVRNFGVDGNLCLDNQYGTAIYRNKFDSRGNLLETSFNDTYDDPCFNKIGYSKYCAKYDKDNNCIEVSFFDTGGHPCFNKEGWAKKTMRYEKGNLVEQACFGIDGNPCLNSMGWSKCRYAYNSLGNPREVKFYDTENELCYTKEGMAVLKTIYDSQGNLVETACFGIDEKPCMNIYGNARVTMTYEHGNVIEQAFYDISDAPCIGRDGFAKSKVKYDEYGNIIEEVYYDVNGDLCLIPQGFAKRVAKYEEGKPWMIEEACYGVDGRLCLSNFGYAMTKSKYDSRGNRIEGQFFDQEGNACFVAEGYAKITMEYNERNMVTKESYFDQYGNPCLCKDGYTSVIHEYDDRGNEVKRSFHDKQGDLCKSNLYGAAKAIARYDAQGNQIETAYFGEDDTPCLSSEGIARKVSVFDRFGQLVEEVYFNINNDTCMSNSGYARKTVKYDNCGNRVEEAVYDTEGNLSCHAGAAIMRTVFDQQGKRMEDTFYGPDEKPCLGPTGFARATYQYDSWGRIIGKEYFDNLLQPTLNNCLVFKEIYEYDEHNDCIKVNYLNRDGEPALWCNQYSSLENEYDERHRLIQAKYYDLFGNYLGKLTTTYNQYSYPCKRCRFNNMDIEIGEEVPSLALFLDVANQTPDNTFVILKWENWSITDQLNPYVGMLLQLRLGQSKRLVILNNEDEPELRYVDGDAIISETGLPMDFYEYACDIYEDEWLNTWKNNY